MDTRFTTLLPLLAALALVGCGGGGAGGGSVAARSTVRFRVAWPETGRSPQTVNSVVVVVAQGEATVVRAVLNRPSNGTTSEQTIAGLPAGALTTSATAYPEADGAGAALATGQASATAAPGETIEQTATLATASTSLDLTTVSLGTGGLTVGVH